MKNLIKKLLAKYCILKEKRLLALYKKDKDWEMYKVEIDKYCVENNKDYISREGDLITAEIVDLKKYSNYLTFRIKHAKIVLKYQKAGFEL